MHRLFLVILMLFACVVPNYEAKADGPAALESVQDNTSELPDGITPVVDKKGERIGYVTSYQFKKYLIAEAAKRGHLGVEFKESDPRKIMREISGGILKITLSGRELDLRINERDERLDLPSIRDSVLQKIPVYLTVKEALIANNQALSGGKRHNQNAGDSSDTHGTFADACKSVGGTYTGTACSCPNGKFVNPYSEKCK